MAELIETWKPLGFVDTSDAIPWRDAYPECSKDQLIGKALNISYKVFVESNVKMANAGNDKGDDDATGNE